MNLLKRLFGSKNLTIKHPPQPTDEEPLWKHTPVQESEQSVLTNGRITILLDKVVDTIVEDFQDRPGCWQTEMGTLSPETVYYNFATTARRYTESQFKYNDVDKLRIVSMNDDEFNDQQQSRIREAIKVWRKGREYSIISTRKQQTIESLSRVFPHSVIQKESHV